jgi:hypothetical protein
VWSPYIVIISSQLSSVGTALGYGLDDQGSRDRFLAGAGNFSLHHRVQNSSGAHPSSYPMGTRSSFPPISLHCVVVKHSKCTCTLHVVCLTSVRVPGESSYCIQMQRHGNRTFIMSPCPHVPMSPPQVCVGITKFQDFLAQVSSLFSLQFYIEA